MVCHFAFAVITCFLGSIVAATTVFDFQSNVSLERLVQIRENHDSWLEHHRGQVKEGHLAPSRVVELFWDAHSQDLEFLMAKSHDIVVSITNRLEVETELLVSDPESVEDLMEVDPSQFVRFLESRPNILRTVLRRPEMQEMRGDIKQYFTNLHLIPLSMRLQTLLFARRWNATFSSLDASMDANPIIPTLLAWDICLKFVQYKDTWLDFFITDLRHSVHGLATVMYSLDALMTRSSVELRDLLVTLLTLHPFNDFERIIKLNDEMRSLLDRQRNEYQFTNATMNEADERRNNGFIAFFNSYMEYAVLSNYMYPFLNMIQRFAIELKIMTTHHVFLEKSQITPVQEEDLTEEKLYFHLFLEYVNRDDNHLYQVTNADLKYYVIQELYRQKKLSFKDFPADPLHLGTIKNVLRGDLSIELSSAERETLLRHINQYLDYHFQFQRTNFTDLIHHMNSKPITDLYPNHDATCALLQDKLFDLYGNCISINPTYSPKSSFLTFNHRQYRSFKEDFQRFHHSKIHDRDVLSVVPPFLQTYEDLRVSFLAPMYRNGSIDIEPPYLFSSHNATREFVYEFISDRVGYKVELHPLFSKAAPRRVDKASKRKKGKKKEKNHHRMAVPSSEDAEISTEISGELGAFAEEEETIQRLEELSDSEDTFTPVDIIAPPVVKQQNKKVETRERNLCESLESFKSSQMFSHSSFRLGTKSLRTLCNLNNEARGTIKWPAFVHLMTELGSRIDKDRAGSRVAFIFEAKKSPPLIVHQPHPGQVMSRLMRKVSMKKLTDLGIIPDSFKLL